MSLVSGYPAQAYHPAAAAAATGPHDFYYHHHHQTPPPVHVPQPPRHYAEHHDPQAGFYQGAWMLGSQPPDPMVGDIGSYGSNMTAAGQAAMGMDPAVVAACPAGYKMVQVFDVMPDGTVKVRTVKRRITANKKERRRTLSINSAFSNLRGCIPNVPTDTKLSKIKTLRLATSYIAYLMDILAKDEPCLDKGGFKAEITKKIESREEKRKREADEILRATSGTSNDSKKSKGRTGWPQAVWASELNPNEKPHGSNGSNNNNNTNNSNMNCHQHSINMNSHNTSMNSQHSTGSSHGHNDSGSELSS